MGAGAPKYNTNAEKWTEEKAINLFDDAIKKASKESNYDFIGEVARDLGVYREIFVYLKDKFTSCKDKYKLLVSNLEANCYSHTKKGDINTAVGIINLKSNHGWTDRVDTTTKDEKIDNIVQVNLGNGINPQSVDNEE